MWAQESGYLPFSLQTLSTHVPGCKTLKLMSVSFLQRLSANARNLIYTYAHFKSKNIISKNDQKNLVFSILQGQILKLW